MIHIIYIYLIINSFIAGNYLFDSFNDDKGFKKFGIFIILFLFGIPWIILFLIGEISIFRWLKREVKFVTWFYLTDKCKGIVCNNKNMTKVEVLEYFNEIASESHKQNKRHNRLIQKRYGTK